MHDKATYKVRQNNLWAIKRKSTIEKGTIKLSRIKLGTIKLGMIKQ